MVPVFGIHPDVKDTTTGNCLFELWPLKTNLIKWGLSLCVMMNWCSMWNAGVKCRVFFRRSFGIILRIIRLLPMFWIWCGLLSASTRIDCCYDRYIELFRLSYPPVSRSSWVFGLSELQYLDGEYILRPGFPACGRSAARYSAGEEKHSVYLRLRWGLTSWR